MGFSRISERSAEPDVRILSRLSWLEKRALGATAVVAGGVLALWFLPTAAALAPSGWSRMTANAAVGLLLATASLALSAPGRSSNARRLGQVAAFVVLALGGLTLVEYCGLPLGLDVWLPTDPLSSNPGRPSPQTSLGLFLAGLSLTLAPPSRGRLSDCADFSAIAFVLLDLVLLGGYIFRSVDLIGINKTNLTSLQTLFCLILLAFIVLSRRASRGGRLGFWIDRGIGSHTARALLPAMIALPFVTLALIEFVETSGLVSMQHTRAIAASILIIAGVIVAWRLGRRTNEIEHDLRLQSFTDQLTNVCNRRGFYALADYAVQHARRLNTGFILFYFDLDGLKAINDSSGHEIGSQMIKQFAQILVETFRKNDVVGRIGGDEFVVLAADTTGTAATILSRLAIAVAEANHAQPATPAIAYSAGHVDVPPKLEIQIDDLINQADARMYEQKLEKGGRCREDPLGR